MKFCLKSNVINLLPKEFERYILTILNTSIACEYTSIICSRNQFKSLKLFILTFTHIDT